MLAVQKWAENKPFHLALLATQAESYIGFIGTIYQIREHRLLNHQFPLPPLHLWFSMYRYHRKPIAFLKTFMSAHSEFGQKSIEFEQSMMARARALDRDNPQNLTLAEAVEQSAKEMMPHVISESFKNNSSAPGANKGDLHNINNGMTSEMSFFLFVWLPCWLIYRIHPTRLYRKARQGDFNAINKLISLDPLMLHDPAIAKRIHSLRLNNKNNAYESLLTAPLKPLNAKIKTKKMKLALAGYISAVATIYKTPLSEPEIRVLFDAVAQDTTGNLIDTDLPEMPDTFAREIRRDRDLWLKMLPRPDKRK